MSNLNIPLVEVLTPISCSVLVAEIIKYVAYNAKQIPFTYDCLTQTLSVYKPKLKIYEDKENVPFSSFSVKEKKTDFFLKQMTSVFENFESTFKNLQVQLSSCNDIKEIVLVLGPGLVLPKHILRIRLPPLATGPCHIRHHVRKNLLIVIRKLQEFREFSDSLFKTNGPTNMFILLGLPPGANDLQSSYFQLIEDFDISERVPQTVIQFEEPIEQDCDCRKSTNSIHYDSLYSIESCIWYKSVKMLKGFKNCKIDGVSAVNSFLSLPLCPEVQDCPFPPEL